jgi:hypothetical protein
MTKAYKSWKALAFLVVNISVQKSWFSQENNFLFLTTNAICFLWKQALLWFVRWKLDFSSDCLWIGSYNNIVCGLFQIKNCKTINFLLRFECIAYKNLFLLFQAIMQQGDTSIKPILQVIVSTLLVLAIF